MKKTIIAGCLLFCLPVGLYLLWAASTVSGPEVSMPLELRFSSNQALKYTFEPVVAGEYSLLLAADRATDDPRKDLEGVEAVKLDWRVFGPNRTPVEAMKGSSIITSSFVAKGISNLQLRSGVPYYIEASLSDSFGDANSMGLRLVLKLNQAELLHYGLALIFIRIAGIVLCIVGCMGGVYLALAATRRNALRRSRGQTGRGAE